jgi:hypothetical protein
MQAVEVGQFDVDDPQSVNGALGLRDDEPSFRMAGRYHVVGMLDEATGRVFDPQIAAITKHNELGEDIWTVTNIEEERLKRAIDRLGVQLAEGFGRDGQGFAVSTAVHIGVGVASDALLPGSGMIAAPLIETATAAFNGETRTSQLERQLQAAQEQVAQAPLDGVAPEDSADATGTSHPGEPASEEPLESTLERSIEKDSRERLPFLERDLPARNAAPHPHRGIEAEVELVRDAGRGMGLSL